MVWTVAVIWFAAVVTPGLNFLLVTRTALTSGRPAGISTTSGVACGTLTLAFAAWAGLSGLFVAFPAALRALTLAGGSYILWSGAQLLIAARRPRTAQPAPPLEVKRAALRGYLTAVTNPKALIFIVSIFAAVPPTGQATDGLWMVALIPAISFSWYTLVALALSTPRLSALFLNQARLIDGLAGLAFLAIGLRLLLT